MRNRLKSRLNAMIFSFASEMDVDSCSCCQGLPADREVSGTGRPDGDLTCNLGRKRVRHGWTELIGVLIRNMAGIDVDAAVAHRYRNNLHHILGRHRRSVCLWHRRMLSFLQLMGYYIPTLFLLLGDQNIYQRMSSSMDDKSTKLGTAGWIIALIIVTPVISILAFISRSMFPDITAFHRHDGQLVPAVCCDKRRLRLRRKIYEGHR